jgi:3-oxoadipate enol-lactonase
MQAVLVKIGVARSRQPSSEYDESMLDVRPESRPSDYSRGLPTLKGETFMGFDAFKLAEVELGSLAYYDTGTGEPLVMHHGGEGNKGQYSVFVPHLADGIWAISYDQRDVVDSFVSPSPYTMKDLADDCVQLMDALGIEKAHVMGISFGGALALNVAVRHPDRVHTLIVGAAPVKFAGGPEFREKVLSLPHDELTQALAKAALSDEGQRDPEMMALVGQLVSGSYMQPGSHRRGAMETHDVSGHLDSIAAPTLLVFGSEDPLVPPENGQCLADGIRNSELVLIAGARHGLASEFRQQVARLVSDFVLAHSISG